MKIGLRLERAALVFFHWRKRKRRGEERRGKETREGMKGTSSEEVQ